MPTITDIKSQVKQTGRYSIYIDGKYDFSLIDHDVSLNGLRRGLELTSAELEGLRRRSLESKAYNQALRYLAIRARSVREMREYLARKEYESEVIDHVINRLEDATYLDDLDFASRWVAHRQLINLRSNTVLRQELHKKGIASDVIQQVLAEMPADTQMEVIMSLIQKKRRQTKFQTESVMMAYLARQGFRYDQIKKALERLVEEI